jgi:hypothetical protein
VRDDGRKRRTTLAGASILVAALLVFAETGAGASSGTGVKEPQYGFSFTLPAGWKQVPLDGSDVTKMLNAATHDDPALASALDSEVTSGAAKGTKVFAIGPLAGSAVPNVNVIVTPAAGAPTGRAFAQAAAAQAKVEFAQVDASHIKTSIAKTHLGATAEATYELNVKSASEFGEQIYLRHGTNVDIVTVTTSSPASAQSNAKIVVGSWRWS